MARASKQVPTHFDLDEGRFAVSPRMAATLCLVGAAVAGSIGAVHYRIGSAEQSMGRTAEELKSLRIDAQTREQAKIECLRAQIANKGWRCPDAPRSESENTRRFQPTSGSWKAEVRGTK